MWRIQRSACRSCSTRVALPARLRAASYLPLRLAHMSGDVRCMVNLAALCLRRSTSTTTPRVLSVRRTAGGTGDGGARQRASSTSERPYASVRVTYTALYHTPSPPLPHTAVCVSSYATYVHTLLYVCPHILYMYTLYVSYTAYMCPHISHTTAGRRGTRRGVQRASSCLLRQRASRASCAGRGRSS